MKALRIGTAICLFTGSVLGACATGESEITGGSGYTGIGGKAGNDSGLGGATGGVAGATTGGFGNGGALGGSAGAGALGGTGADGGTGGFGNGGATGGNGGSGATGGSGGTGATGGGGTGATGNGGTGGSTGGTGGSTGGTGGSTGGTGGSTGGTGGGTGGTTNIIPTNCGQSHGLVGCCGSDNNNYYWECAKLNVATCPGGTCGWNAASGWYDCGFTGSDPSGVNKRECGLPNPQPAQCPGVACCSTAICGSLFPSPAGCYCDSLCVLSGDCCPNACSVCGAC